MIKYLLLLVALFVPGTSLACRCRQQPLEYYFNNSDLVFIGKVSEILRNDQNLSAQFTASGELFKGQADSTIQISTPTSSATCGMNFKKGTTYVVFASGTAPIFRTNSCSGTRELSLLAPSEASSFVDVPAQQVTKALYNLSVQEKLNRSGIGGVPTHDSLIGLLEIPLETDQQVFKASLEVFKTANLPFNPAFLISSIEELEHSEIGYEAPSVQVFEKQDGWLRVKSKKHGYVWLRQESANTQYHDLSELLPNRLGYVTDKWDRLLWPEPGAGSPATISAASQKTEAIEVLESKRIAGSLWLKIRMYREDPCSGTSRSFGHHGWIPAWNSKGELTSWFWSRGC